MHAIKPDMESSGEKTLGSAPKLEKRMSSKARIERAALTLFSSKGIDGVSTKEIAKQAGLSEGSIYRHFKSKESLARTLMLSIHEQLTGLIKAAATQDSLEKQIEFIVRQYCEIADTDWDRFRYHILNLHHFPNLSESALDNPQGAASALLHAAMERGDISKSDPALLASMSLGIVLQPAQSKVLGLFDAPLSPFAERFTHTILTVIQQDIT